MVIGFVGFGVGGTQRETRIVPRFDCYELVFVDGFWEVLVCGRSNLENILNFICRNVKLLWVDVGGWFCWVWCAAGSSFNFPV